jgi:putative spermidine/putrescine transport system permease protein
MESSMTLKTRLKNIGILFVIFLFVSPVILLAVKSISFGWKWGELFPTTFNFRGWKVLLTDPRFYEAIVSSLLIGTVVIMLNLFIAIPAGRALAFYSFKGKALLESLLILPIIIPSLAVAMGLHFTMIRLGIADHWLGVVVVHLLPTVPYAIKILHSGFERIGPQWEEQATTLGASKWYSFYTIYLPLLLPSIRSTVFLIFVISLSQYVLTALIGGGNIITLAMLYFPFLATVDEAVISSFSFVFAILPIMIVLLFELLFRLFVPYRKQ